MLDQYRLVFMGSNGLIMESVLSKAMGRALAIKTMRELNSIARSNKGLVRYFLLVVQYELVGS